MTYLTVVVVSSHVASDVHLKFPSPFPPLRSLTANAYFMHRYLSADISRTLCRCTFLKSDIRKPIYDIMSVLAIYEEVLGLTVSIHAENLSKNLGRMTGIR